AEHLAALRIDAGHHVLDRAILPRCVHGLKDQQDGVAVGGVEQLLQGAQLGDVLCQELVIVLLRLVDGFDRRRPVAQRDRVALLHPKVVRIDLHCHPRPVHRVCEACVRLYVTLSSAPRAPWAAMEPALVGLPTSIASSTTPNSAPNNGPAMYSHVVLRSPRTRSGANERTGFIEAPLTGAAHSPASAMYPPTAIAPLVPMLRAPVAVPSTVLTSPAVSRTSIANARPVPNPAPGTVAPSAPAVPNMARRKSAANTPPAICART